MISAICTSAAQDMVTKATWPVLILVGHCLYTLAIGVHMKVPAVRNLMAIVDFSRERQAYLGL